MPNLDPELLLDLIAVADASITRTRLAEVLTVLEIRDGTGPHTAVSLRDPIERLRHKHQISGATELDLEPGAREPRITALVRSGRYLRLADAFDPQDTPFSTHLAYLSRDPGRARREYRRAVLKGDLQKFNFLSRHWRGVTTAEFPELLRWFRNPWQPALLATLSGQMQSLILRALQVEAHASPRPTEGLMELMQGLPAKSGALALHLAREHLLRGEGSQAAALIESQSGPATYDQLALAGFEALQRGDVRESSALYAKALAAARQLAEGQVDHLPGLEGAFLFLSYALHGTAPKLKAIRTSTKRHNGGYSPDPRSSDSAMVHLERLASLLEGQVYKVEKASDHPTAILVEALVRHWAGDDPIPQRIAPHQAWAEQNGYRWLAAELASLSGLPGPKHPSGVVPLKDHLARTSAWEQRLDALDRLLAGSAPSAKPALGPRVAWLVQQYPSGFHVEVRVQSPTAKGWSKGKKVAHSRLAEGASAVPELADHDLRLAGAMQVISHRSYRGYPEIEYRWPLEATWEAMIGHPNLFDFRDEHPIEVVARPPALRLEPGPQGLVLRVVPEREADERVVAEQTGPYRYEVTVFDAEQLPLVEIIGEGLVVPKAASARLGAVLAKAAARFAVLDETGLVEAGEGAETLAADPRPVIILLPQGTGLRARGRVRPLGEAGPDLLPGHGATRVIARVEGSLRSASRDLPEETARLEALTRAVPGLSELVLGEEADLADPESALEVLEGLHQLGEAVVVAWPEGKPLRLRGVVGAQDLKLRISSGAEWFEPSIDLLIDGGLQLQMAELLALVEASPGRFIQLEDGGFLALTASLRRALADLARVARSRKGAVQIPRLAAGLIERLVEAAHGKTDAGWRAHLKRQAAALATAPALPTTLEAELRPYQIEGYAWACRLAALGAGGILADDMGLGKTVQALALLLQRAADGPALVVAPTSVCGGWLAEARRFAPSLQVHRFGVGDRGARLDGLGPGTVLVCSYGLVVSEAERLADISWSTLILDEAQAIKNPETQRHKAVASLRANMRLSLSGTPIENHVGELWAAFSVLNPGMLGPWRQFKARFFDPIVAGDKEARAALRRLVLPFVLRRTKAGVLDELPPRTEVTLSVELSPEEAAAYELLRRKAVEELASAGPETSLVIVLAHLTRLRLACCHPGFVMEELAHLPGAKLRAFQRIVLDLKENHHRALVFSQFVRHLTLLRGWLDAQGISYQYLDGSTPALERDRRVAAFQAGEGDLFLISLRAGGSGLNLTGADYVLHMDPWWNPAVEDQASDRAHRIGQTRPVTVYRLVARGTIEEQILALHRDKRDMADQLLSGAGGAAKLSAAELIEVLRGSPGPALDAIAEPKESGGSHLVIDLSFQGVSPPTWRRIALPAGGSLADLHQAIADLFSWSGEAEYLISGADGVVHAGVAEGLPLAPPRPGDISLTRVLGRTGDRCTWRYDLDEEWLIDLRCGGLARHEGGRRLLAGEGPTPPEDAGGTEIWQELLATRSGTMDPARAILDGPTRTALAEQLVLVAFELEGERRRFEGLR